MPVPDSTPSRTLVIRRGTETYKVDEAKFDTVLIMDGKTYKGLGFEPVAVVQDGVEIPYEKREHIDNVPGRPEIAAIQIEIATADGTDPIPAVLVKAAATEPEPAPRTARGSKETPTPS